MNYLVVGLGNPGEKYEHSRHNVGFMAVDRLQVEGDSFLEWKKDKYSQSETSTGVVAGENVTLVKPMTFMNKIGLAVKYFVKNKEAAEKLIVVHDDVDLSFGTIKITFGRGSAGHRGVESIIHALSTKDFIRVRVGVTPTTLTGKLKKPKGEGRVRDFLLSDFSKKEQQALSKIVKQATQAVETIVLDGKDKAMNQFNQAL